MSMDGPCTVVRGGGCGMRGFNNSSGTSSSNSSVFASREQVHQQQAVRFGVAFASPAAPATASSAAWDANDEPLPDILSAPTLRSVSSLVMSMDADESVSAAARNNGSSSGTNKNSSNSSGGAAKDVAVSGAMGSKMVDMLMTPLPAPPTPMDTSDRLTREQSFPPPFRPRLNRDQSFPPIDMLPSSSSLRPGWPAVPTSSSANSGGGGMVGGGLFAGTGGAPSLSKFPGLGYQGAPSLQWSAGPDQDAAGGQVHRGSGNGGPSLGNEGGQQHGGYYDPAPPSSSRQRHSSFDKLAEMIPGIPQWTTPSSSPSASAPQSTGASVEARDMHSGGSGGSSSSSSKNITKAEPTDARAPGSASRATPLARGRQQHPTSSTRPERKIKKQHLRRTDSSPPHARWSPSVTAPSAAAAAITKRPQPTGTGKRSVEPPLPCGPIQPGGGPVDLAQQERRRIKIQRYLYKRSRRKFAKSTRDASPSRSRPKAAAKRPRIKGKFVKTVPDFVSVNDRHPREGAEMAADQQDAASPPSPKSPAAGVVGCGAGVGGQGRRGGVRSVRNGGSVNVNFNARKAFSTTPSSSLLPRGGGGGGGARLLPALATNDGAPSAFLWPMSMPM